MKWYWILLIVVVSIGVVFAVGFYVKGVSDNSSLSSHTLSVFAIKDKFYRQYGISAPVEITKDEYISMGGIV
jgi:hypothetical protein